MNRLAQASSTKLKNARCTAAETAVADLHAQAGEVQRQLHEPRLVEW